MTALESALLEVTAALEYAGVRYMLIGGLAVSLWGEPRSTLRRGRHNLDQARRTGAYDY